MRKSKLPGAEKMRNVARALDATFYQLGDGENRKIGFCLLVFEFHQPGICNYVSNAERESMLAAMREAYRRLSGGEEIITPEEN